MYGVRPFLLHSSSISRIILFIFLGHCTNHFAIIAPQSGPMHTAKYIVVFPFKIEWPPLLVLVLGCCNGISYRSSKCVCVCFGAHSSSMFGHYYLFLAFSFSVWLIHLPGAITFINIFKFCVSVLCTEALHSFLTPLSLSLPHSTLGGSGYKFGLGLNFLLLVLHYINCFRTFIPSLFSIALGVYALAWDVLYIVHNWLRSIIWFVYNLTTVKKIYLQLIAWLFFTNLYIISR